MSVTQLLLEHARVRDEESREEPREEPRPEQVAANEDEAFDEPRGD